MVTGVRAGVDWLTLRDQEPGSERWLHSGIALLADGRVVHGAVGGGAIVVRDEPSGAESVIPLPIADAHGITATRCGDDEWLWIADPGPKGANGQVLVVSPAGDILSRTTTPLPTGERLEGWRPTSVAVVQDGPHRGTVWIADGYGGSRVHRLTPDGRGMTVDAAGGVRFDCPHGIAVDDRGPVPTMAVADRGNRRIVFLRLDGSVDRIVSDERMTSPSCIAVRGDSLVVTDLRGAVLTLDREDRVHVRLGDTADADRPGWPNRRVGERTTAPLLHERRLNSPHGVATGPDGDVYLTEWLYGGRVIRLSWRDDDAPERADGRGGRA